MHRTLPHHTLTLLRLLFALCLLAGCRESVPVWQHEDGVRWIELRVSSRGQTGFTMVSATKTGVGAANLVSDEHIVRNRFAMHGSGIAVGDVDGDDLADIFVARLYAPHVLYRNLGGWRFEDVTTAAGVACNRCVSTGAAFVDLDGDRDLDLIVTMLGGPNAVYFNDGTGHFVELTSEAGIMSSRGSTSVALADVDSDGDLDLYVANYKRIALADSLPAERITWEAASASDLREHYFFRTAGTKVIREELAEPDVLYLNDGTGRFRPVDWTGGAFLDENGNRLSDSPRDWALTARFHDVNGDGYPDLYVCNDYGSEDVLWLGNGKGTFKKAGRLAIRKTSHATMSVDFSDVDRDGHVDVFLTDMLSRTYPRRQTQRTTRIPVEIPAGNITSRPQEMQNVLLKSRGDGTFAEIAHFAHVAASEWSWATSFLDVDLDGWEDILITTGHVFDVQDLDALEEEQKKLARVHSFRDRRRLLLDFPDLKLRNVAFRNRGDLTFEFIPDGWGLGPVADVAHGMALGDLDNDGDLDAVINRFNEVVGLYRNDTAAPRIAVRLRGDSPNTSAVGARITLGCPGLPDQTDEITSAGQYLSSSEMVAVFAALTSPCRIDVVWPDGKRSVYTQAHADRLYELEEHAAVSAPPPAATDASVPLLESYPAWRRHVHRESSYEDFLRQPLLPRRLSRRGPAAALADVDQDGDDDLVLGSGMGGRLAAFENVAGHLGEAFFPDTTRATGDLTGIVALPIKSGETAVFVGVSNYERTPETTGDSSYVQVYRVRAGGLWSKASQLDFGDSAVGPLAAADLNADGAVDLFAGGHFLPGRYPEAVGSRLWVADGGAWVFDSHLSEPFAGIGLISGAAFGDLDGDGDTDAVLAAEWGPIRIFLFEDESFEDHTADWGLDGYRGLWSGVTLGDFDEDGRLDIAASNVGWNTSYGRPRRPLRLYYADVDLDGITDLLEGRWEESQNAYVPVRSLTDLARAVPLLRRRVGTFAQLAGSTIPEMLGPGSAPAVEAVTLGSIVFMNRESRFDAVYLPAEAQWSAAFGLAVLDLDADGHEDLVVGQNLFALPLEVPRQDAGRGLVLRGNGDGSFTPLPGHVSGLKAYGEQRAVASSDLDADGKADLVLTQNAGETLAYRNASQRRGIRVRLEGPKGNLWGVGSTVRLRYSDGSKGPARVVAAGSGYWSQNSAVQVMGPRTAVSGVWIRWPDGAVTDTSVGPETTAITVRHAMLQE